MTNAKEWIGAVGDGWAREWQRTDRSLSELTSAVLPAIVDVAPNQGRAIDIGCGAGETAIALAAARPDLAITGIDISEGLLQVAHDRAKALSNVQFELGDAAERAAAHAPIDLYLSRHGVMFFEDPVSAFARFHDAAAADGRIIFSCFRDWSLNGFARDLVDLTGASRPDPDAPGPFAFADESKVRSIFAQSGWQDASATPVDFSYIVGQGDDPVAHAVSFMTSVGPAAQAIRNAYKSRHPEMFDTLRQICERHREDNIVRFDAAAWIWSARA